MRTEMRITLDVCKDAIGDAMSNYGPSPPDDGMDNTYPGMEMQPHEIYMLIFNEVEELLEELE
tara:strand:+ start:374 stop:562 length:189 start_codon:yes stop_codon:yes gene_type:complete